LWWQWSEEGEKEVEKKEAEVERKEPHCTKPYARHSNRFTYFAGTKLGSPS
jgi:hypothetical protein